MINKAKADRKEIKVQLDSGISKEKIIEKYDTDENFKAWLQDFKSSLSKVTE